MSSHNEFKSRFEAYNRLQAAAVAFGEKLPIPEIVAIGGQSDGKSSLLEALLGFRFNVREVEMGTRRPLILQMVHDSSAFEPRCRFQVSFFSSFYLLISTFHISNLPIYSLANSEIQGSLFLYICNVAFIHVSHQFPLLFNHYKLF